MEGLGEGLEFGVDYRNGFLGLMYVCLGSSDA